VTTEFTAAQGDLVRRTVLSLLHGLDRNTGTEGPEQDAQTALRYLQGAQGAKMGLSRDPNRRYEGNRGEMELWLKVEVPGTGPNTAAPPTPYPHYNRFGRHGFGEPWDDPLMGGGGHMSF